MTAAALLNCKHRTYREGGSKCPGCGWCTHEKYCTLDLDIEEHGLCSDCWQEVSADVEAALVNLRQLMCSGKEPRISPEMLMRAVLNTRQSSR